MINILSISVKEYIFGFVGSLYYIFISYSISLDVLYCHLLNFFGVDL